MTKKPTVLILGRPNVGKSTLINRIIGKRRAITHDLPGVTRDVAYFETSWKNHIFDLVDSGGVLITDTKDIYLQDKIEAIVQKVAKESAVILFIVDYQDGLHPKDKDLAHFLRKLNTNVIVVVNKIDTIEKQFDTSEFMKMGFDQVVPISAAHGLGTKELLDLVIGNIDRSPKSKNEKEPIRVALVGRPNVGKSSFINGLLNEDRVIVDSKAGTTRDSIDVDFHINQQPYVLVDTAGMRRKSRVSDDVEYYSTLRSSYAIEHADVVVLVLDASDFLRDQDKKIINLVLEYGRNLIIFVNKWDLTDRTDTTRRALEKKAQIEFPPLINYPFLFGSATLKHNQHKVFELATKIDASSKVRHSTAKINKFIEEVVHSSPLPSRGGKSLKVLYATQVDTSPPQFVFFVNKTKFITDSYKRFLEKKLRQAFGGYFGSPLQIKFKPRRD